MEFNLKKYQKNKIKTILKTNQLLFLATGPNQNAQNWIVREQQIYELALSYNKVYNSSAKKIFKTLTTPKSEVLVSSTFFFFKPTTEKRNKKTVIKSDILNKLNSIEFSTLSLKLNKKIYSPAQLKTLRTLHYKKSISVKHQFLSTALKSFLSLNLGIM